MQTRFTRRLGAAMRAGLAAALCVAGAAPQAQTFPSRPLRLIVPYAAGGSTDVVARVFAQKYGEVLGQPVVIENRPGGSALIGMRAVASAAADGYTLLMSTPSHNTAVVVYKEPGFALSDFALVAPLGSTPMVMLQNPALPARTLKELIAYAKANPSKLNAGTLGGGAITQMLVSRFKDAAQIDATDIFYGGNSQVHNALLSGTIDFAIDAAPTAMGLLGSSRLRGLAITSDRRSPLVPDIPTFKELGFPTMTGGAWFAIFTPAKVPQPVLQQLRAAAAKALAAPDLATKLATSLFVEPWHGSDEDFERFLHTDYLAWRKDAERLGLVGSM